MPNKREKIINKTVEILENYPNGIRYSELFREIKNALPDIQENTIHGTIWDLDKKTSEITKPERGIFILKKCLPPLESLKKELVDKNMDIIKEAFKTPSEESFYQPFADYLMKDLEECTKAIALGGNKFGDKWGTPDVFGIYKFSETEPIRPPVEIISAEIKIDTNQLVTAFGQACSYKLFSHKVYLVVPKEAERDLSRIESLCSRFGIGLILFDRSNSENPNFKIRTRATKNEPDYFYINEYLRRLGNESKKLF